MQEPFDLPAEREIRLFEQFFRSASFIFGKRLAKRFTGFKIFRRTSIQGERMNPVQDSGNFIASRIGIAPVTEGSIRGKACDQFTNGLSDLMFIQISNLSRFWNIRCRSMSACSSFPSFAGQSLLSPFQEHVGEFL